MSGFPIKHPPGPVRPSHRADRDRRAKAQVAWLALVDSVAVPPWVRARLSGDAFLGRARSEDYEALEKLMQALQAGPSRD